MASHARRSTGTGFRALSVVLAACAAGTIAPRAVALPVQAAGAARNAEKVRTISTQHYSLVVEGSPQEAEALGLVLEAAYKQLRDVFSCEPRAGKRMVVKAYLTEQGFLNAAWSDGATVPAQCRPSFWSEANTNLYAFGPLDSYTTRQGILFGAALQFHALCESKNRDLHREWYEAGLAHGLSRHTWDGRDLVLKAKLLAEPFDYPVQARKLIEADPGGLPGLIVGDLPHPVACWAAVGLCTEAARGRYKTAYDKYILAKTGSKLPGDDFLRSLGAKEELVRDLYVWLEDQQTPFELVTDGFEDRGRGVLRGATGQDRRALCLLKDDEVNVIEAVVGEVPKLRARPGIVTGYTDEKNLVTITVVAPMLRVDVFYEGKIVWTETIDIAGDHSKPRHVKVTRKGPNCQIEVDGVDLGTRELPRGRQGLFVEGGPVEFKDVRWQ